MGYSCPIFREIFAGGRDNPNCEWMGIDRERLMNDVDRIFYGFVVVIAGLVAVSVGYLVAVFTKLPESDVATALASFGGVIRSEEHTSELQSLRHLVCRLLL